MPRATRGSWEGLSPPETLLQRSAYLDACVSFITRESPPSSDTPKTNSVTHVVCAAGAPRLLYNDNELSIPVRRQCSFCEREGTRLILANPFSERCQMLLCSECAL